MALTILSNINYTAEVPELGSWGTVSKVSVKRYFNDKIEHQDRALSYDAIVIGGYKADISFEYTYITGSNDDPVSILEAQSPVTFTDLDSGGQLPGSILLTSVEHTFSRGDLATASCEGVWYPDISVFNGS